MKKTLAILSLILLHAKIFSQSSTTVCNVTVQEKAWVFAPGRDSLTRHEFITGGKLSTTDNKYSITSFQVLFPARNSFGFIIFGNNLLKHDYSNAFYALKPGDRVLLQCIQVKDKWGKKQVLPNLSYYIVDSLTR